MLNAICCISKGGLHMKTMGLNEIRSKFLEFFESKDHLVQSSYSLVPQNDKSLLLIAAGMAPLKNYFIGAEEPPNKRMSTCQKCIRTGDIENVGHTSRHATFFEMLGNFSFGDYFKHESIAWGWEFVTDEKWLGIPTDNLWVTVYEEDDEAFEIWENEIGVPKDRIVRLGKEDNFWEIGTGPCGPCSEIYYDRGEKYGCDDPDCKPGCDCDRFVEFWNHVFTQFDKDEEGVYHRLENPNIDTGMGLERVACLMQNVDSIFEIDTIKHILDAVIKVTGKAYGSSDKDDVSLRIITDHIRAVSFMVGDGILPNNEGRGYVLRRLLRRAARHGKLLGVEGNFLFDLVDEVIHVSGDAYPELVDRQDYIKKIISIEEERFQATIDQGLEILMNHVQEMESKGIKTFSGADAFKLYDTYGFPLDLTEEIIAEKGIHVDKAEFDAEMEAQRERARSARENMGDVGWEDDVLSELSHLNATVFKGYTETASDAKVLAIVNDNKLVNNAAKGSKISVILDKTPIYAESGGQIGDHGFIQGDNLLFKITDCKKGLGGLFLHIGEVLEGEIKTEQTVAVQVEMNYRMDVARNHTATHLLHKALKEVLGSHVEQAGSLVEDQRLRFDFTHFQAMTVDEIDQVEKQVNARIFDSLNVIKEELTLQEAKAKGATALFGEKYGEKVRVVSVGDYSMELCGGTHLENSSQIGMFKMLSETGVAAGVRRIEAITGRSVYSYLFNLDTKINGIADQLKTNVPDVEGRIESLLLDLKKAQKENDSLKQKAASKGADDLIENAKEINGIKVITAKFEGLDANTLRTLGDKLKDQMDSALIVLATVNGSSISFISMATDEAIKKGAHAGNVVREVAKVAGGGGGGRPNMAQAGGKDASKVDEALAKVYELL